VENERIQEGLGGNLALTSFESVEDSGGIHEGEKYGPYEEQRVRKQYERI